MLSTTSHAVNPRFLSCRRSFFFLFFLPRSLPLLRLIEETVESTVAATEGWPRFSAAALYIRPRLQVGAVSFGQPGHHLIKKTDRGLIIKFGNRKCFKRGGVSLVWAVCQSNVCCLFLIIKERYAIIIQHVWVFFSFFEGWGNESNPQNMTFQRQFEMWI